jgi:hypothetical protein
LARAVFIHRLGEIRDRTYENQQHRASGLNLLVTVIILWNTRYLERAVAALRQTEDVPDQLLAHLSPLGWEHVNLTGDYIWSTERPVTESRDGFRPLRAAPDTARKAAYVAAVVLTQLWVMLAWVFFRCDSASQATEVLTAILGLRPHPGAALLPVEGWILAVIGIDHTLGSARLRLSRSPRWVRSLAWSGLGALFALGLAAMPVVQKPFIYFQF